MRRNLFDFNSLHPSDFYDSEGYDRDHIWLIPHHSTPHLWVFFSSFLFLTKKITEIANTNSGRPRELYLHDLVDSCAYKALKLQTEIIAKLA